MLKAYAGGAAPGRLLHPDAGSRLVGDGGRKEEAGGLPSVPVSQAGDAAATMEYVFNL